MDSHLTRRSLLAGGAGVLAAGLTRVPPAASAAEASAPQTKLEHPRRSAPSPPAAPPIELPAGADLLGLSWAGAARRTRPPALPRSGGQVEPVGVRRLARPRPGRRPRRRRERRRADLDGRGERGPGPSPRAARGRAASHRRRQRRRRRTAAPSASAASLALAGPPLAAGAGQPPIIARRSWALGISPPRVAPEYGSVQMAFVHHTENPNGYSRRRGARDAAGDLRLPHLHQRLERHRLQLRRRPVRAHLRGPRRRHHRGRHRRARRRLQLHLDRRLGARDLQLGPDLRGRQARAAVAAGVEAPAPRRPRPAAASRSASTPPAPSTANTAPTPASCSRTSPATATATRPNAPATSSTASCPRSGPSWRRLSGTIARLTIALGAPVPAAPAAPGPEAGGGAAAPTTTTPPNPAPAPAPQRTRRRHPHDPRHRGARRRCERDRPVADGEPAGEKRSRRARSPKPRRARRASGRRAIAVPATGALALRALFPGTGSLGASVSEGLALPARKGRLGQAPGPAGQPARLGAGEPPLGVGLHQQRGRRPPARPLVAGLVRARRRPTPAARSPA